MGNDQGADRDEATQVREAERAFASGQIGEQEFRRALGSALGMKKWRQINVMVRDAKRKRSALPANYSRPSLLTA